ncbi:MAG: flavin reductase [Lewinellaceae bacterium]|nr:flavin reductase [Lewinellaceae bacterium]
MERHIALDDILQMEPAYRRNLMNSISGFKACNLIGTASYRKVANVAIFSSVVHIGATPPLLGFIMRPLTVPRQTYHNIKARGFFTVNAVTKAFYERAHQTSAKYPEAASEFEACGLTPQYTDTHPAPYVGESPVKLGLQLEEEHHIRANGTIFIVGKVVETLIDDSLLTTDGHLNLEQAGILTVAGLDSYYEPELLGRLDHARP